MAFLQSQSPSQSSLHSSQPLKTFRLLKYSSAVSNEGAKSHRWKHDTRSDVLQLSFTYVEVPFNGGQYEKHLELVVSAGMEVLERADIHQIAHCSREYDERRRYNLISTQVEAPVQLVAKFPCIALRYPGVQLMVCRFQLKFDNETDYLLVRDTLRDIGLPLKESGTASRPASRMATPSTQTAMTSFVSPSSQPQWPPLTTQSQLSQHSFHRSSPTEYHSNLPAAPMRPESSFGGTAPRLYSPDLERVRSASVLETSLERPMSIDSQFRQPLRPAAMTPPASSFSFVSGSRILSERMGDAQRPLHQALPSPASTISISNIVSGGPASSSSPYFLSENTGRHSDTLSSPVSNNNIQSQYYFDGKALRRSTTSQPAHDMSTLGNNSQSQTRHSTAIHDLARPVSAPLHPDTYDVRKDDISTWMPPRRELPFPKVKAKVPKAQEIKKPEPSKLSQVEVSSPRAPKTPPPSAQPITKAAVVLSPAATKPKAKVAKKGAAQRRKASIVVKQLPEVPDSQERLKRRPSPTLSPGPEAPQSPLAAKSATGRGSSTESEEAAVLVTAKENIPARKRRAANDLVAAPAKVMRMVDGSTQTQTGSGRDHTALARVATPIPVIASESVQQSSATALTAQPMMVPPHGPVHDPRIAAASFENAATLIEECVEKHIQPGKQAEFYEHPQWDTASEEERRDIVEDWMIRQLDNPKFLELCQTMETVWQRSAMDLGF